MVVSLWYNNPIVYLWILGMVKKIACFECNGNGRTTSHIEPDGGGFTSNEWSEMDDDFRENYFAGNYDKKCNTCNGTGKIEEETFTECMSCTEPFEEPQIEPYCSESCYLADYRCNCGKQHCGWCA
tara:strand:- start:573 stop:950 length:378 start_codon:yes stop_codon:yes gene_type:complete